VAQGPVTVVALGDSLTAGDGDDAGKGFVGRLTEAIAARPGREGSTLTNLGQSGWDSTMMVSGQDGGAAAELPQAVAAARAAAPAAVLATVLIGSNDLWYVYQNGTVNPTPSADEDALVATYRANLQRTVAEMQAAGAVVVVGLPDDQSVRPIATDIARLNQQLSDVTAEEVGKMSALAKVLARTATEVAAAHGARTVDTNDPLWADPARMADDGIHPNATGYTTLANRWLDGIAPLL
jgi:lysophospholipase L1-like esterase